MLSRIVDYIFQVVPLDDDNCEYDQQLERDVPKQKSVLDQPMEVVAIVLTIGATIVLMHVIYQ